jgi:hypothetical protein
MDLIRKIMLALEADTSDKGNPVLKFDDYSNEMVKEHVRLIKDAGFIEGTIVYAQGSTRVLAYSIFRITNKGYDFIDASRSDSIWNNVVNKIKEKGGSFTIDILLTLLKTAIAAKLAVPQ